MSSLYFQDANGPSAEAILIFSDGAMVLILPIATGVLVYMFSLIFALPTYSLLIESQLLEFT